MVGTHHFHPFNKGWPWSSRELISGQNLSGWWFQPIWKIWVKLEIFPNFRSENRNIWNHHLEKDSLMMGWPFPIKKSLKKEVPFGNHHDFRFYVNLLGCIPFFPPSFLRDLFFYPPSNTSGGQSNNGKRDVSSWGPGGVAKKLLRGSGYWM